MSHSNKHSCSFILSLTFLWVFSFTPSGPGICEGGWNQIWGGTSDPLLPKTGFLGPSLREDDRRLLLLKVSIYLQCTHYKITECTPKQTNFTPPSLPLSKGTTTCLMSSISWCCCSFTTRLKSTTGSQVSVLRVVSQHSCSLLLVCSDPILLCSPQVWGSAASSTMPGGSAPWRTRSLCSWSIQTACFSAMQWSTCGGVLPSNIMYQQQFSFKLN